MEILNNITPELETAGLNYFLARIAPYGINETVTKICFKIAIQDEYPNASDQDIEYLINVYESSMLADIFELLEPGIGHN